jgi:uncharacterized membrane protein YuzA (DUF378 family)
MSPTLSLIIGIILGLTGLGMLIYLFSSSPMFKKNREKLRKQRTEQEQSHREKA